MSRAFDALAVGSTATWTEEITAEQVDAFVALSGDDNVLHTDDAFARRHGFRGRVVHGMLVSAFLSRVIGTQVPGPGALWLSQSTRFLQPTYIGDRVTITVRVAFKSPTLRWVLLETTASNQRGETIFTGEAKVMMLDQSTGLEWRDTVVLVTGGSRGLGAAIARSFGERHARVIVQYHTRTEDAAQVVEAVHALGGQARAIAADLTTGEGATRLAEEAAQLFGGVHVLVNNASPLIERKSFEDTSPADLQRYWMAYVHSAFTLAQALVPGMKERRYGRIINLLTSYLSGPPPAQLTAYVTAKSALWGLTKALAVELAPHGITVNGVSPSPVLTDQWAGESESRRRALAMRNPMRTLATPDDVAQAVLYLATEQARYVTGTSLLLAGGEVM